MGPWGPMGSWGPKKTKKSQNSKKSQNIPKFILGPWGALGGAWGALGGPGGALGVPPYFPPIPLSGDSAVGSTSGGAPPICNIAPVCHNAGALGGPGGALGPPIFPQCFFYAVVIFPLFSLSWAAALWGAPPVHFTLVPRSAG